MSTKPSNYVKTRTEIKIEEKSQLIVLESVSKKINYLHEKIGSIEWSGLLLYSVDGTIRDPENLILTVQDIVLMDVGTSGYTEYDFDAEDPALYGPTGAMGRVMDNGWKIGHIHTHHTMGIFFSGTDTAELHENAPKHNYYLSLIVGIGLNTRWQAKIAYVGQETTTGIVNTTGDLTITQTWTGESGIVEEEVETTDLSGEEEVNEVEELLNIITMNIDAPEVEKESDPLGDRIIEIKERKIAARLKTRPVMSMVGNHRALGKTVPIVHHNPRSSYIPMFEREEIFGEDLMGSGHIDYDLAKTDDFFGFGATKLFLQTFLPEDQEAALVSLEHNIAALNTNAGANYEKLLKHYVESFQDSAEDYFRVDLDSISTHALAIACIDVLNPYRSLDVYSLIADSLSPHIMTKVEFDVEEDVRAITGINDYLQK